MTQDLRIDDCAVLRSVLQSFKMSFIRNEEEAKSLLSATETQNSQVTFC